MSKKKRTHHIILLGLFVDVVAKVNEADVDEVKEIVRQKIIQIQVETVGVEVIVEVENAQRFKQNVYCVMNNIVCQNVTAGWMIQLTSASSLGFASLMGYVLTVSTQVIIGLTVGPKKSLVVRVALLLISIFALKLMTANYAKIG